MFSTLSYVMLLNKFILFQLMINLNEAVVHWSVLSAPYKYVLENMDNHKLDLGSKLLGKAVTKYATYDVNQITYEPFNVRDVNYEVVDKRETYFKMIFKLDNNKCLSLMVCECCADPVFYGDYGMRVNDFFRFMETDTIKNKTFTSWFKEAADLGSLTQSTVLCKDSFPNCKANIKRLSIVGRAKLGF